jgi:hypothetical protein
LVYVVDRHQRPPCTKWEETTRDSGEAHRQPSSLRKKITYYHTFTRINHTFFRMFYMIILDKYA